MHLTSLGISVISMCDVYSTLTHLKHNFLFENFFIFCFFPSSFLYDQVNVNLCILAYIIE